jgi:hypothetical protein
MDNIRNAMGDNSAFGVVNKVTRQVKELADCFSTQIP